MQSVHETAEIFPLSLFQRPLAPFGRVLYALLGCLVTFRRVVEPTRVVELAAHSPAIQSRSVTSADQGHSITGCSQEGGHAKEPMVVIQKVDPCKIRMLGLQQVFMVSGMLCGIQAILRDV